MVHGDNTCVPFVGQSSLVAIALFGCFSIVWYSNGERAIRVFLTGFDSSIFLNQVFLGYIHGHAPRHGRGYIRATAVCLRLSIANSWAIYSHTLLADAISMGISCTDLYRSSK